MIELNMTHQGDTFELIKDVGDEYIDLIVCGWPVRGYTKRLGQGSKHTGIQSFPSRLVCQKHQRNDIGFELNPDFVSITNDRVKAVITEQEYSLF